MTRNVDNFQLKRAVSQSTYASIFSLIVGLGLMFSPAFATIPISSIAYGVTYPSGTLNAGDTAIITIWAGSSTATLDDIVGFDITLELTAEATFPSSLNPDFSSSWIANGGAMSSTVTLDTVKKTIQIHSVKENGSESGEGTIVQIFIVANTGGISASDLLQNSGGGVIITVDDINWRLFSESTAEPPFSIGPNPTQRSIRFFRNSHTMASFSILSSSGNLIHSGKGSTIDFMSLGLPPGRYFIRLTMDGGAETSKTIIYE